MILRLKGIDSTNAPPRPIFILCLDSVRLKYCITAYCWHREFEYIFVLHLDLNSHECQCHHSLRSTTNGYSFIPDISIAPLHVHYYSEALPATALKLCRS